VFVKLEKRLFNDPRFYMLSEKAQLNYVKLMLFAAETYNRIPTNLNAIRKGFKTNQSNLAIENTISEIQKVFPKFKKNGEFYYFEDFETKTNYIRECPGVAEGTPKEVTDIDKEKDKEEEEEKEKYAECVSMTKIEYEKLTTKYGKDFTIKCIEKLDNYKGSNGKKYKSDYRTILNWVVDEIKKNNIQQKFNKDPLAGIK